MSINKKKIFAIFYKSHATRHCHRGQNCTWIQLCSSPKNFLQFFTRGVHGTVIGARFFNAQPLLTKKRHCHRGHGSCIVFWCCFTTVEASKTASFALEFHSDHLGRIYAKFRNFLESKKFCNFLQEARHCHRGLNF
jgi:hypothetical protein